MNDEAWLSHLFNDFLELGEEHLDYLLGRGAKLDTIKALNIKTWEAPVEPCPIKGFTDRYGEYGERLEDMLAIPLYSPRGQIIGAEFRSIYEKRVMEYRTQRAQWNPVFAGLKKALPHILTGGSIYITEGIFDMFALEWVLPQGDVAISTIGARLSKNHINFLARFAQKSVNMVYDNDETGRNATWGVKTQDGKCKKGALELLERQGLDVRAINYHGAKDPGEIWDRGGATALRIAFPNLI